MSAQMHLRPLRFTEILDGAMSLYRQHFRLFFGVSALYFVCDTLIQVAFAYLEKVWAADFLYGVVNSLFSTLAIGVMIIPAAGIYLGRQITFWQVIRRYLDRLLPYFVCSVIYIVISDYPMYLPESKTRWPAVIHLAAIFIGYPVVIYFLIAWILYGPVLMGEQTTAMEAFGRSRSLVRGSWWRVCGVGVSLFILVLAIIFIFTISFTMLLRLLGLFQADTPIYDFIEQELTQMLTPNQTPPISVVGWVILIFSVGISAWVTPIYAIGITRLYFNKKTAHALLQSGRARK